MSAQRGEENARRRLVVVDSRFPFGGEGGFLQREADLLKSVGVGEYYDLVSFVCIPLFLAEKSQAEELPAFGEAVLLDAWYRPVRCWGRAVIRLLSRETIREWKASRKLHAPPTPQLALKRMLQYYVVRERLSAYLEDSTQAGHDDITVYSYWLNSGAYAAARTKEAGLCSTAVARCHGSEVRDDAVYVPFRKPVQENLDAVFFVAEERRARYERILSDLEMPSEVGAALSVSRLGVPTAPMSAKQERQRNGPLRLVSVSSIVRVKRLDRIVRALRGIDEPVTWTHIGDGPLRREIESLCAAELADKTNVQVEFLGALPNDKVIAELGSGRFDFLVNTSESEGVPVSIMEAMSVGLPVVAPDVGSIREIVTDGINGRLLTAGVVGGALSQELVLFGDELRRPGARQRYTESAIQTVRESYMLDENLGDFYALLRDLGQEG